jgi:hypothetical protein
MIDECTNHTLKSRCLNKEVKIVLKNVCKLIKQFQLYYIKDVCKEVMQLHLD